MRTPIISLALLVLSSILAHSDRATFDDTKTQLATPLPAPPVIDGVIDAAEWKGAIPWNPITVDPNVADGILFGSTGDGAVNPPVDNNDLSFEVFVGYDSDNLYIAVRVKDDVIQVDSAEAGSANGNTWMDDSVEVFIDGDNSNFATRDTTGTNPEVVGSGGQFVITANNAYREAEAGNPGYGETAAWFAKTATTDTGYEAEFRISLKTIGNPKPGDIIGFTVAVNDDDDGAGGERQVIWVGSPHTEATYGNLVIGGKSYSAPKTAAPTVDGVIHASEYPGASEIKVNPFTGIYDGGDDAWEIGDHGFSAWVVHDADAVYVAVDVTDDNIVTDTAEAGTDDQNTWEDDSVEIFFDADHDHEPARGALGFEGQYVLTANGAHRDNEAHNPTFGQDGDWIAATSKTATGFQVEFKVKKSALSDPQDGAIMGFHIAINDDDGTLPSPKMQLGWSGRAHEEYTYGHLTLLAGSGGGTGGDKLTITSIKVNSDKLELSFTSPKPSDTHVVEQTSNIGAAQWTVVANVVFSSGAGGALVATFPKPTSSPAFYRVRLGSTAPAPLCSTASVPETWANTAFANQTGTFTVQFEATPSAALMDTVMALSSGVKTAFSGFACLTRFNVDGNIDARNAGEYLADNVIPYSANVTYTFRMVVNIPAHTYSIYVTPAGGTEQTVGTDFAFRSDQSTVTNLDHWGVVMTASGAAGTNTVCNFRLQ